MKTICIAMVLISSFFSTPLRAQQYSLLIRGGHVIDVKNNIDGVMDIAVTGGKVALVARDIPANQAEKVIQADGMFVTPGFIDTHVHAFVGNRTDTFANGIMSITPDDVSFRAGVTTVVDCGTSGWRNFPQFKKQVIDPSKTRVLAFLNIFGTGMISSPAEQDMKEMDVQKAVEAIKQNPGILVGIKIGHYSGADWSPFDGAIEAGKQTNLPIIIEAHLPKLPLPEMFAKMRAGDIFSQAFKQTTSERLSIVDDQGKVRPYVFEAQKKGVLFDVGHGGVSFHFSTAIPAFQQGIMPNSFGTDMHRSSINGGMKDMLNVMSKYLNMGMSLKEIFDRATWRAATIIKRTDLGHLSAGAEADITITSMRTGSFGFLDAAGKKMAGSKKLECEMTIRAGKIAYDLNGIGNNGIATLGK